MKRNASRLFSALMALCMALTLLPGAAWAAEPPADISVTVCGRSVAWTDAKPFIDANGRTMVPLRAVADAMSLKVSWYALDREVAFTDGSKIIYFPIDNSAAYTSGGSSIQMDTAAVIANDRTYAPIRYLAEYFGYEVGWDAGTRTVVITKGGRTGFVCGETAPHDWTEANYQAPATCTVCGATQGSALAPDFVTHGIDINAAVGTHHEVETVCYGDPRFKTVGDFTVLAYNIVKSDNSHPAKDGYEWRVVTIQFIFGDENVKYGIDINAIGQVILDYYRLLPLNENGEYHEEDETLTATVSYYGKEVECTYRTDILESEWQDDGTAKVSFCMSAQVPVGYDGCVYGVYDYDIEWPDGVYLYEVYDPEAFFVFHFA